MLSAPVPDTLVAMFKIPIPVDEEQRLEDFHQLDILLTKPEAVFDDVVDELSRIFEVPGVMMSFIDHDTQYFKSAVGLPPEFRATRTEPRELSICSHVVGINDMLVIEDLLEDERYKENPAILASGARFYAGTPLRADSGRAVGTLCIVDVKPRTMNERERDLLRLIANGVMAQVKLRTASHQLLQRSKQIERDLHQAVQMQRFLLPPEHIEGDGWRIDHVYRPIEHLGGDFVDISQRPDGRLAILVADVTGHGTTAALTAAMTKTAFRRAASSVDSPTQILTAIHGELYGMVRPGRFMTALAALFDPAQHQIEIASAGHPYPLLVSGSRVKIVDHANEMVLLVESDQAYEQRTTIKLPRGDRLLIYTDGATEATDPDGRQLGIAGLSQHAREAVSKRPGHFLEELFSRLIRYTHNRFEDDVALLCIESL